MRKPQHQSPRRILRTSARPARWMGDIRDGRSPGLRLGRPVSVLPSSRSVDRRQWPIMERTRRLQLRGQPRYWPSGPHRVPFSPPGLKRSVRNHHDAQARAVFLALSIRRICFDYGISLECCAAATGDGVKRTPWLCFSRWKPGRPRGQRSRRPVERRRRHRPCIRRSDARSAMPPAVRPPDPPAEAKGSEA